MKDYTPVQKSQLVDLATQLLSDNNALLAYIRNIDIYHWRQNKVPTPSLATMVRADPLNWLLLSFKFSATPEGTNYWGDISAEWNRIIVLYNRENKIYNI